MTKTLFLAFTLTLSLADFSFAQKRVELNEPTVFDQTLTWVNPNWISFQNALETLQTKTNFEYRLAEGTDHKILTLCCIRGDYNKVPLSVIIQDMVSKFSTLTAGRGPIRAELNTSTVTIYGPAPVAAPTAPATPAYEPPKVRHPEVGIPREQIIYSTPTGPSALPQIHRTEPIYGDGDLMLARTAEVLARNGLSGVMMGRYSTGEEIVVRHSSPQYAGYGYGGYGYTGGVYAGTTGGYYTGGYAYPYYDPALIAARNYRTFVTQDMIGSYQITGPDRFLSSVAVYKNGCYEGSARELNNRWDGKIPVEVGGVHRLTFVRLTEEKVDGQKLVRMRAFDEEVTASSLTQMYVASNGKRTNKTIQVNEERFNAPDVYEFVKKPGMCSSVSAPQQ